MIRRFLGNRLRGISWFLVIAYILGLVLSLYLPYRVWMANQPRRVDYTEFLAALRAGRLEEVAITPTQFLAMEKPSGTRMPAPVLVVNRLPGMDETSLLKEFEAHQVKIAGQVDSGFSWGQFFWSWMPMLALAAMYAYGYRRMSQGIGSPMRFGKNRAKIADASAQERITFADVAGIEEAKAELVEIVDYLRHPEKYRRLGGRIPKGVLLVGPPGTGKTLLARAVAGEAEVPFFALSGSEFVEMFVGVGAARVRELFEQAKEKAPCIVFIDELDAIGKSRSAGRGLIVSHDEREQTLNQLLVEMDGFDSSAGVILMAATNTPEVLDPALLRAGRFDRQVVVDRPDLAGREAILAVHARKVRLGPDVNLRALAGRTPGMVGADLANVVNEGALLAARRGADQVEMRDLEEAIDRVMLGLEKKSRVMTPDEKERVAYHEAGHALAALSVPHADPVHRLSIIPRTVGALGHMLQLPTQERYLMTKPQLEDQITVMLGGRAAEDVVYHGVVSTGASDDLQKATELARQMVMRFGMSDQLGQLTYGRPEEAAYLRSPFRWEERTYSERTAEEIDAEVRRLIDGLYERARSIVNSRKAELERLVERLLAKETLDEQEIATLVTSTREEDKSLRGSPAGLALIHQ